MGGVQASTWGFGFAAIMFGPRWVDSERLGDVRGPTLVAYRRAGAEFLAYLDASGFSPHCAEEFDDLLVEWSVMEKPRASSLRYAVAAVEFVYPRFRGELKWARQRLDTLGAADPPAPCRAVRARVGSIVGRPTVVRGTSAVRCGATVASGLGIAPG